METCEITPKNGRPSEFKREFIKQAEKLVSLGATDQDLADFFNVSKQTIYNWQENFPKFLDSIKSAKAEVDAKVEKSLFQRAVGYSHEDVDIRAVSTGNNQGSEIIQTPITKHFPPSEVACIFWLKNRKPAQWRDVQRIEHTGKDGEQLFPSLNDLKMELMKRGTVDANGRLQIQDAEIVPSADKQE